MKFCERNEPLHLAHKIIRRHDSVFCVDMDQEAPWQIALGEIAHVSASVSLLIFQGHFLLNQWGGGCLDPGSQRDNDHHQ